MVLKAFEKPISITSPYPLLANTFPILLMRDKSACWVLQEWFCVEKRGWIFSGKLCFLWFFGHLMYQKIFWSLSYIIYYKNPYASYTFSKIRLSFFWKRLFLNMTFSYFFSPSVRFWHRTVWSLKQLSNLNMLNFF